MVYASCERFIFSTQTARWKNDQHNLPFIFIWFSVHMFFDYKNIIDLNVGGGVGFEKSE